MKKNSILKIHVFTSNEASTSGELNIAFLTFSQFLCIYYDNLILSFSRLFNEIDSVLFLYIHVNMTILFCKKYNTQTHAAGI